jgi:hypothetical protein
MLVKLLLSLFSLLWAPQVRIPGPGGRPAVSGGSSFALIASTSATGIMTTPGITTTGANLLIVEELIYNISSAIAPTDLINGGASGNTWSQCGPVYTQGGVNGSIWYSASPHAGANHTFSVAGTSYSTMFVSAWSGAAASSPCDEYSGAGIASGTTVLPGSITTAAADLLISFVGGAGLTSASASPTMTNINSLFTGQDELGADGYVKQGSAGVFSVTWTVSPSATAVAAIAAFKP